MNLGFESAQPGVWLVVSMDMGQCLFIQASGLGCISKRCYL